MKKTKTKMKTKWDHLALGANHKPNTTPTSRPSNISSSSSSGARSNKSAYHRPFRAYTKKESENVLSFNSSSISKLSDHLTFQF